MIANIELTDIELKVCIGAHSRGPVLPEVHVFNLLLTVRSELVCTVTDKMTDVFDYDPILDFINDLVSKEHYETQECLITKIAAKCAKYDEVTAIDISIRKKTNTETAGHLGIRLRLDKDDIQSLRN